MVAIPTCKKILIYLVPTEESVSWFVGRNELPEIAVLVVVYWGLGLVAAIPGGPEVSGLWGVMPIGGLGAEFGKFMAILFAGNVGATPRDDEAGMPSRAAIICARSWKSLCFDLSSCSLTLIVTLSISLKNANLLSNLCSYKKRGPF